VVEQDVGVGLQPGRGVAGAGGFGQVASGSGGAMRGRRLSARNMLRHRLVAIL
jgi:hypothetical protein